MKWKRKSKSLEDGGKVQQATMLFDPEKGETRVMRLKEDAHDYRYFPDPDLLPVIISDGQLQKPKSKCLNCHMKWRRVLLPITACLTMMRAC